MSQNPPKWLNLYWDEADRDYQPEKKVEQEHAIKLQIA